MATGKVVRGALYIHRSAASELPASEQSKLNAALVIAGPTAWNVVRLEKEVVALLDYEEFEVSAFPSLKASTRVDLAAGTFKRSDFSRSHNPLILHRKEQLMRRDDSRIGPWVEVTRKLVEIGMFKDSHLIGRRDAWLKRLAAAGLTVAGDEVLPL
jgi:DNA phosphorothioation-associated putative methyltransferase